MFIPDPLNENIIPIFIDQEQYCVLKGEGYKPKDMLVLSKNSICEHWSNIFDPLISIGATVNGASINEIFYPEHYYGYSDKIQKFYYEVDTNAENEVYILKDKTYKNCQSLFNIIKNIKASNSDYVEIFKKILFCTNMYLPEIYDNYDIAEPRSIQLDKLLTDLFKLEYYIFVNDPGSEDIYLQNNLNMACYNHRLILLGYIGVNSYGNMELLDLL